MLNEKRFFLNNSNGKFLSFGIVPATKILDAEADGFHFEVFLCGEKSSPIPLGGLNGLAALFDAIREVPAFSRVPSSKHGVKGSENIVLSTGFDFAKNVRFCIFQWFEVKKKSQQQ